MPSNLFCHHRTQLAAQLERRLIVVSANTTMQRVNDMAYPFEQDSNFFYLTGISAADWTLVMDTGSGEEWLIAPDIPEIVRVFDGNLSSEEAAATSGVTTVLSAAEGVKLLRRLRDAYKDVSTVLPPKARRHSAAANPARARLASRLKRLGFTPIDIRLELSKLRAIKDQDEIVLMKQAAALTMKAFVHAKEVLPKITAENELQAEFDYAFTKAGSSHAYDPIVASGPRACTLHYVANDQPLPKNGLVLIDIGAKIGGYCADVTRTYAIGQPSDRERAVHAAVERTHHEIIALLQPGLAVADYQRRVDDIMQQELKQLGLLRKPTDYRRYFPHAISHGLGIDVHDSLGAPTHFKPGMVLTVEPGIYISEEGIGVRIEDDILITETGSENLTGALSTSL